MLESSTQFGYVLLMIYCLILLENKQQVAYGEGWRAFI